MTRLGIWALSLLIVVGLGCGDDESDTGFPHGIDCSSCSGAQVCWYTLDEEGSLSDSGCLALPAECSQPASCDCVNAATEKACDQVGWQQNSDACTTVQEVPVVECISTLG